MAMTDESQRLTKTVTIAHDDRDTIEDGIDSLRQIPGMAVWEADETRTTVIENGETDEVHVEGVEDDSSVAARVAIDYLTDPPRVIVHGDPVDEEPTDVVSLESVDGE
jgi:3-phenylpropionate/cinnamic acid dioxygenase small subunit